MGLLEGKGAFITGAARGQGRSHADSGRYVTGTTMVVDAGASL